jgi:hypothetical protein
VMRRMGRYLQDVLFRTLAGPTRRAIFERLCREGEHTVRARRRVGSRSRPSRSISGFSSRRGSCATATKVARSRRSSTEMAGLWQGRFDKRFFFSAPKPG